MTFRFTLALAASLVAIPTWAAASPAQTVTVGHVRICIDHNAPDHSNPKFYFGEVQRPSTNDVATSATFTLLDGAPAPNSGGVTALHDGKLPTAADDPQQNFFFREGTDGGTLLIDLGKVVPVQAVNTYSCHPSDRAPQIYSLYGSDGTSRQFAASPSRKSDLTRQGWLHIASVSTGLRPDSGGQWAVSISGEGARLGKFRYLLLDIHNPELNTFFSEIDVIAQTSELTPIRTPETLQQLHAGAYRVVLDTSQAPELTQWAGQVMAPAIEEWYPKIAQILASPADAPSECTIAFQDLGPLTGAPGEIVAFAQGPSVICRAEWFRRNTGGEALGCVIHELVHVVQQYPATPSDTGAAPGWVVEGIADYIRWFLFEPQSHGAELTARNLESARYDSSYRITANFLNWVVAKYGGDIISRLNAAARAHQYQPALWQEFTGHTLEDLGREWIDSAKANLKKSER